MKHIILMLFLASSTLINSTIIKADNNNSTVKVSLNNFDVTSYRNTILTKMNKDEKEWAIESQQIKLMSIDPPTIRDSSIYPLHFYNVGYFVGGLAPIYKRENGKEYYGWLNKQGDVVIPQKYNAINNFNEGLAYVELNDQVGFINNKGEFLIGPIPENNFKYNSMFSDGYIYSKTKYMDISGSQKTIEYGEPDGPFAEGLSRIKLGGKYGYIDSSFNIVIPPKFEKAGDFIEGYAKVEYYDGDYKVYGFIDKTGKLCINLYETEYDSNKSCFDKPCYFRQRYWDDITGFSDGLALIRIRYETDDDGYDCWGYMNKQGKIQIILDDTIEEGYDFSEGLAEFRYYNSGDDSYGYINKNGEIIIPPIYQRAEPFNEGLARVVIFDKIGYINTSGDIVIKPQFKYGSNFNEGLALVETEDKCGYIRHIK